MTQRRSHRRRRFSRVGRRGMFAAAAVAAGLVLVVPLFAGMVTSDNPANEAANPPSMQASSTGPPLQAAEPELLGRSVPSAITIPSIGVDSKLEILPQEKDKETIQLPAKPKQPGWYDQSATPGQLGITTVVGYIAKAADKPGVFHKIGKLDVGDRITMTREDGQDVVFTVYAIKFYPEGEFPADDVYADPVRPELRLITCGGTINPDDPPGNLVVRARMSAP